MMHAGAKAHAAGTHQHISKPNSSFGYAPRAYRINLRTGYSAHVSAMAHVWLHNRQLSSLAEARWPRQRVDTGTRWSRSALTSCAAMLVARCWLAVCVHNTRATPPARLRACATITRTCPRYASIVAANYHINTKSPPNLGSRGDHRVANFISISTLIKTFARNVYTVRCSTSTGAVDTGAVWGVSK